MIVIKFLEMSQISASVRSWHAVKPAQTNFYDRQPAKKRIRINKRFLMRPTKYFFIYNIHLNGKQKEEAYEKEIRGINNNIERGKEKEVSLTLEAANYLVDLKK